MMPATRFEIIMNIGTISVNRKGWNKELNLVSWNGGEPVYDIREWSPEHDRMTAGIVLSGEELAQLVTVARDIAEDEEMSFGAGTADAEPSRSDPAIPPIRPQSLAVRDAADPVRVFYCKGKEAFAMGVPAQDGKGFVVRKGSRVVHSSAPSLATNPSFRAYYRKRNELMTDGTIVDHTFTRDTQFRSASAASAVVLGKPSNGKRDWITAEGVTLGEVS